VIYYVVLVSAVALERLAELVVSRRNLAWLRGHGGIESGAGHYPVMVALHVGLLVGCLVEAAALDRPFEPLLGWSMFAAVLGSQALRWWCIGCLGHRWNTRVVIVPGLPLVSSGPYRWFRHPNYLAVVIEGAALPLVRSAWIVAVAFTVLNAMLLSRRLHVENVALASSATA